MNQRLLQVLSGRNIMFRPLFFVLVSFTTISFLSGCSIFTKNTPSNNATLSSSIRQLTETEMKKYNLTGVLREARICRNSFNAAQTALVVTGECELISCDFQNEKLVCFAEAEK